MKYFKIMFIIIMALSITLTGCVNTEKKLVDKKGK